MHEWMAHTIAAKTRPPAARRDAEVAAAQGGA